METTLVNNRQYLRAIIILSVLIPLLVGFLLFTSEKLAIDGTWTRLLPPLNALLNSATAILLLAALAAIKKKRIRLHRNLMLSGLILGSVFLLSYVLYHSTNPSVIFGDANHDGKLSVQEASAAGSIRTVYLFTLLSHIFLSIVVVPFVLLAFYFALSGQIKRHQKIVKYTFPVWLYVSITGVLVYLLISPYYF